MRNLRPEYQALVLIAVAAALAAAVVAYAAGPPFQGRTSTAGQTQPHTSPTPLPSVVPGPLDGQPTPRNEATRRPIVALIDNFSPDARPQSGLSRASVVMEALIEGGVTRLEAVFLEHDAPRIGPIRSARPYFVKWAAGFRGVLVHAGGSPAALQLLLRMPAVGDVNALGNQPQFKRSKSRVAPYNLYTSTTGVRTVAQKSGLDMTVTALPLHHKLPAPRPARGLKQTISIDFSTPSVSSPADYAVTYKYSRRANVYTRYVGGQPAIDALTRRAIVTANLVTMVTPVSLIQNDPQQRVIIGAVGHGPAIVFRDGHAIHGTWAKASAAAPIQLTDSIGRPIALNPGTSWFEVVPRGAVRIGSGR